MCQLLLTFCKLLFTFVKKSMNRFMFSHNVQKVAMLVLIVDMIALLATIFISILNHATTASILQSSLLIVGYVSLFFCVFSCEKIEDEFISSLRARSISVVAIIAFVIIIVLDIVQLLLSPTGFTVLKEWRMEHFWNGNFIAYLAAAYLILLKISVKHYNK